MKRMQNWLVGSCRRFTGLGDRRCAWRAGGCVEGGLGQDRRSRQERGSDWVLYGSPMTIEKLFAEFNKKYPEIKIIGVFGRGADVAKRFMAERRAEKYLADLYVNGQTTGYNVFYKAKALDPIPPLLCLAGGDRHFEMVARQASLRRSRGSVLAQLSTAKPGSSSAYNTKLVNPAEIKSYWDLLNPKWKGKIVAYNTQPRRRG